MSTSCDFGWELVLKNRVREIKMFNPKVDHYEAFEMACTESKQEWLQTKNQNAK